MTLRAILFWETTETDLKLDAPGLGMSVAHTRQYSNQLTAQDQGNNGNSWTMKFQPYITHDNLGADPNLTGQTVVKDLYNSLWFDYSGGNYSAKFFVEDKLTRDSSNKLFVLTKPNGAVYKFYDHSTSRVAGSCGGAFTATLVRQARQPQRRIQAIC